MHSRGRDKALRRVALSALTGSLAHTPAHPRGQGPHRIRRGRRHLAKILLLRLQGIEVTSDSDPRIAAVRDEDFDACFVPFGPLDDGRGPHSHQISVQAAPDPEARRAEALRAKERLWESEARRFTEERCKHAALKRGQDSASVEQDRIRLAKQKEAAAAQVDLRRRRIKPTARTLNFALVPPAPKPPSGQKFTYDFPFTPRNINIPPRSRRSPERKSPQPHAHEEAHRRSR
ncbi:hypothetical protein K438DRAFT_1964642 [Mycena galopus ATCC 62051]|nr:hypothetical protein K438DRAFT_1964642 [Mycena galopus ATCC 62051]